VRRDDPGRLMANLYIFPQFAILSAAKDTLSARASSTLTLWRATRVLYTGIKNNIQRRVWEHKHDDNPRAEKIAINPIGEPDAGRSE
jgi:hypothetical protein